MEEAKVLRIDGNTALVRCPFCLSVHKHGIPKGTEIDQSVKMSHCLKLVGQNYLIVNPFKKKES